MAKQDRRLAFAGIVSFLLFIVMLAAFYPVNWSFVGSTVVDTALLSQQMFNPGGYGVTLLVVAVLLGASMVGGVYLAKEE